MTKTMALRVAAVLGFMAVALGAFGAHGLKPLLEKHGTLPTWETAVFYHFIHTIAMLWLTSRAGWLRGPWFSFLIGILIFSGSLYLLGITGVRWLGAITPIGGVSFLVGWIWLAVRAGDPADRGVS